MALSLYAAELILQLRRQDSFPERVRMIELGAQQLSNAVLRSRPLLGDLARAFGIPTDPELPEPTTRAPSDGTREPLPDDAPLAFHLWTHLGVAYASVDLDGSPGSIPLDLNYDEVPPEYRMAHDLVTNFGTTEHIANQLNAFKIVHDLTKVGGIMIHHLPAQGNFNHGLINYSPKFFWMLARSNGYEWLHFDFTYSGVYTGLPANLIESITPFKPEISRRCADYRFTDAGLMAALRRNNSADYVPPLDISDKSLTGDPVLRQRYPTRSRSQQ